MSKEEKARFELIKKSVSPAKIYELVFAVVSETEWAASAALIGGGDRRFRFLRGQLLDEANIGDARA
ncbi:hypothetical protein EXS62_02250 [Candidatus Kaiserbacteria bacterium]|nr:hypothetical protein [Candidatus Kaiserbacteria bacterium]